MGILGFIASGNYTRFYKELQKLSETNEKKPALMFFDAAVSAVCFGSGLQDYLNYRFYEKSYKERNTYVTVGRMDKAYRTVAGLKYSSFISDKINFHCNYSDFAARDFLHYRCEFDELKIFLKNHPEFVLKPKFGLGGHQVVSGKADEIEDLEAFHRNMQENELFLEEKIVQHKGWAELSPHSVNTLRIMTEAVNGKARIIFAGARIGSGKSVADNFHQGGLAVPADLDKGCLVGPGYDKQLNCYDKTPNGAEINGFPIPYCEKIKETVLKAALVNDKINLVGWDVAITENGPELIEGNRGPGWDLVQVVLNRGTMDMLSDVIKHVKKNSID